MYRSNLAEFGSSMTSKRGSDHTLNKRKSIVNNAENNDKAEKTKKGRNVLVSGTDRKETPAKKSEEMMSSRTLSSHSSDDAVEASTICGALFCLKI